MGGIAPAIDMTARTFEVLRSRGHEIFRRRVGTFRYNDTVATGLGPGLIDVMAWYQEQNAHYYDRKQINSLLALADTREAMVYLTRAQSYRMRPATSASVAVQASPSPPQSVPVTLLKGTRVAVGDLTFEVAADATIPAGAPSWPDGTTDDLIVLVEGATRTASFQSTGEAWQKFPLGLPGTIEGSVKVEILGETWEEVQSLVFIEGDRRGRDTFVGDATDGQSFELQLLNAVIDPNDEDTLVVLVQPAGGTSADARPWRQVSALTGAPQEYTVSQTVEGVTTVRFGEAADGAAPGDGAVITAMYLIVGAQKRYQLTYDADDQATIRFGDGVFGIVPPAGATIRVTYRTGGGVRGNVAAGAINTTLQGVLPTGARTGVLVRNLEAGSGGEPPETVDHARYFAPRYAASNRRAVRKIDWTTLAATYVDPVFGAPAHASAYLKQSIPELNTVQVAVWGRDANGQLATAGTPLKVGIRNFLNERRTICTSVEMVDGTIVLLDIDLKITLQQGRARQDVFAEVTRSVTKFFNSTNVLPGQDLSISTLYTAIQNTAGVARFEIVRITGAVKKTMTLGSGNGVEDTFGGKFALLEGTTVLAASLVVTDGVQQVVDDGDDGFTGDVSNTNPPGTNPGNFVDLTTGEFSVQFTAAPAAGRVVTAEARLGHFFPRVESIGDSDGTISRIDGGTDYYPIVKRAPRGLWSGDRRKVLDGFQVSTTATVRGVLPKGIIALSLSISDGSGQTVADTTGNGALIQTAGPGVLGAQVGTVDYNTGAIDFIFNAVPTKPIVATWTTKKMDIYLPADLLPIQPGRVFIWGGYDADGAQPGGQLIAYDDGDGNIVGNVLAGGVINYANGHIEAEWNTAPPPGAGGGATLTATLSPAPDGNTKVFTFTTGGNLSSAGSDGVGRSRLVLSALSKPGVVFEDAYDNSQGGVHGESLDREGVNVVNYTPGTGTLTFKTAPAASAPGTFPIEVTNVAMVMYAGWVFRVKTPGGPGLDKGLFADNNGRFWGPPGAGPSNAFPTDRLDHTRGRFYASLAGASVANGRTMDLSYDAMTGVPPALDIPLGGDEVAGLGRLTMTEAPPEAITNE